MRSSEVWHAEMLRGRAEAGTPRIGRDGANWLWITNDDMSDDEKVDGLMAAEDRERVESVHRSLRRKSRNSLFDLDALDSSWAIGGRRSVQREAATEQEFLLHYRFVVSHAKAAVNRANTLIDETGLLIPHWVPGMTFGQAVRAYVEGEAA